MSLNLALRLSYKSTHSSNSMSPLQQHALNDNNSSIEFLSKAQSTHFDCFLFILHPHSMKNSFIYIYKHNILLDRASHKSRDAVRRREMTRVFRQRKSRSVPRLSNDSERDQLFSGERILRRFIHSQLFVIKINLFCMNICFNLFLQI